MGLKAVGETIPGSIIIDCMAMKGLLHLFDTFIVLHHLKNIILYCI